MRASAAPAARFSRLPLVSLLALLLATQAEASTGSQWVGAGFGTSAAPSDPAAASFDLDAPLWQPGEVDRATLISFVDGVRNDRRRHPLVRALATDVRGQLHEDAGELDEARELYADNGRLLSWRIIGPFDNQNRTGHDKAYAPELEAWAPGQSFAGKLPDEPVDWRAYEPENTIGVGYVSFDEFFRPNEYVTAYATTWVRAPKAMDAVMHLGTGGAH